MRVTAARDSFVDCPQRLLDIGIRPQNQVCLTKGNAYEVWSVSIFEGIAYLLVIDDNTWPTWYPSWLFSMLDPLVRQDWICSIFDDEPSLLLGPAFIAASAASYEAMVEYEHPTRDAFWDYVQDTSSEFRKRALYGRIPRSDEFSESAE